MKKCIMYFCLILLCVLSGNIYAQKTNLIPLDENIYLHPNKNILEMRLPQDEINNLMSGGPIYSHITKIASLFKDDFDAYVFALNLEEQELVLGGFTTIINNQIEGIGHDLIEGDLYATHKRLRGYIVLTDLTFFSGPLLHEICHLYGAPNLGQVEVDNEGNEYPSEGHWGISDVHGQLGGFDSSSLTVSDNNKFQASCYMADYFNDDYNGFNMQGICKWEYAPLELYLMGLIPVEEVPDIHIYKGISETNADQIYKDGTFTANEVITYTPTDLIKKLGKRIPNYKDSSKELSLLTIVLTEKPLTDTQWVSIQEDIRKQELQEKTGEDWPINFWEATGGRGTIKMSDLDKSLINGITTNEVVRKNNLRITNGNIYSDKTITIITRYDWGGKMLGQEKVSTNQIPLKEIPGNIFVIQFIDGSIETIKKQ